MARQDVDVLKPSRRQGSGLKQRPFRAAAAAGLQMAVPPGHHTHLDCVLKRPAAQVTLRIRDAPAQWPWALQRQSSTAT